MLRFVLALTIPWPTNVSKHHPKYWFAGNFNVKFIFEKHVEAKEVPESFKARVAWSLWPRFVGTKRKNNLNFFFFSFRSSGYKENNVSQTNFPKIRFNLFQERSHKSLLHMMLVSCIRCLFLKVNSYVTGQTLDSRKHGRTCKVNFLKSNTVASFWTQIKNSQRVADSNVVQKFILCTMLRGVRVLLR